MGTKRGTKVAALTQVNGHILEAAVSSPSGAPDWEFYCECGRAQCESRVTLTLDEFVALRDEERPVLAPGHWLSAVLRAQMLQQAAAELRDEAAALRAEAKQARRVTKRRP